MSKAPPSLTCLAFNLGFAALLLAAFYAWPRLVEGTPLSWLVVVGQVSLFVYVLHIVVYKIPLANPHSAPRSRWNRR